MVQRLRFWPIAGLIFSAINIGGAIYAALQGEMMHATAHVVLLAATIGVWQNRVAARRDAIPGEIPRSDPQIEQLQVSVDALAVEIERIGENQRFITKLQEEKVQAKT